jgi:hypothetical protein
MTEHRVVVLDVTEHRVVPDVGTRLLVCGAGGCELGEWDGCGHRCRADEQLAARQGLSHV